MKRTPLKRNPNRRGRASSARWKAKRNREYLAARAAVLSAANGRCQARIPDVCTGRADHAHHMLTRARGGSDDVTNLLPTCLHCHSHIHLNPKWATEAGFLRSAAS